MILLFLTQSRGATLALILSMVVASAIVRQNTRRLIAIGAMSAVTCALCIALAGDVLQVDLWLRLP